MSNYLILQPILIDFISGLNTVSAVSVQLKIAQNQIAQNHSRRKNLYPISCRTGVISLKIFRSDAVSLWNQFHAFCVFVKFIKTERALQVVNHLSIIPINSTFDAIDVKHFTQNKKNFTGFLLEAKKYKIQKKTATNF